ncbi:protein TMED8 [Chiloscyllium plagiosum]|uniref:protein TMED8 n=1 Tax=Chiloscyllium plagiosum TaxID=36176 RepID=UPI001CB87F7B|nr:protein TMED8 [Chiloscyllium plagiosum]
MMASGAAAGRCPVEAEPLSEEEGAGEEVERHSEGGKTPSRSEMKMGMNLGVPGTDKQPQEQEEEKEKEKEQRPRRRGRGSVPDAEPEQNSEADMTSQLSSLRVSEESEKCQMEPGNRPQNARLVTEETQGNSRESSKIPLGQTMEAEDEQLQQDAKDNKGCEITATALAAYRVRKVSSDSVIIQSDHGGPEKLPADPLEGPGRVVPVIDAAATWISTELNEFKEKIRREKAGVMKVNRGNVVTVRVPTHPEGNSVCWDFATDTYDIGFGVYFEWTPVTDTEITVLVSESSDEEDEEETEAPPVQGDIERGKDFFRSELEEILPVYRKDSHLEVQSGSHKYPGQGVYLLKFDNSYSIWRHKTLYYQVNYSS